MGARQLAGCTGCALGTLTGQPPRPEERASVVEVLTAVAEQAPGLGTGLALEACNRDETHLCNTLADTRRTVLDIGAPSLKLHADTHHMHIGEGSFETAFVQAADGLGHVHMSDSQGGRVGRGTVNWDQVWAGLQRAEFSGPLVLESSAGINPASAAATCLWRAPRHDSATLAREGLRFLRARAGLA